MTDEPVGATPAPETTPVATPVAEATQTQPVATAEDDFDETLIPEGSRENFKKYRESQKTKQAEKDEKLNAAIRRSYELEARLNQFSNQQSAPLDPKEVGEPPKIEEFKTIEDYNKAVIDYGKKLGAAEYRAGQSRQQSEQQRLAEAATMAAKGRTAMQKYPDFAQVVQPLAQVADQIPVLQQFIREFDTGTDVLYHLCKNPMLLEGLMKMTPFAAGRELLRLETMVTTNQAKAQTKAPAPITPVGGGDGSVTKLIDLAKKDNVEDYIARSNREKLRRMKGLN